MARIFSNTDFGLVKANFTFNGTKFDFNGAQSKDIFSSKKYRQRKFQRWYKLNHQRNQTKHTNELKAWLIGVTNYHFTQSEEIFWILWKIFVKKVLYLNLNTFKKGHTMKREFSSHFFNSYFKQSDLNIVVVPVVSALILL